MVTPAAGFLLAIKNRSCYYYVLIVGLTMILVLDQYLFVPKVQDALWSSYFMMTEKKSSCSLDDKGSSSNDVTVSILLFGIPKSFQAVWDAYRTNIIESNPHVRHFDVYMHLYSDVNVLTNLKNNERRSRSNRKKKLPTFSAIIIPPL